MIFHRDGDMFNGRRVAPEEWELHIVLKMCYSYMDVVSKAYIILESYIMGQ